MTLPINDHAFYGKEAPEPTETLRVLSWRWAISCVDGNNTVHRVCRVRREDGTIGEIWIPEGGDVQLPLFGNRYD